MSIAEQVLLLFSRNSEEIASERNRWQGDNANALSLLCEVFPDFLKTISGKRIVDFGCGAGRQAIALAQQGAECVLGIENNPRHLQKCRELLAESDVKERVEFKSHLPSFLNESFDIIISQNSMEHFQGPLFILRQLRAAMKKNGRLFITFGPPWFAPYGSHARFFTEMPWVNLLFREQTVMKVRSHFRPDGARCYEDAESGLNKMTVRKFERLLIQANLRFEYRHYECVKRMHAFARMPLLRELFINRISCILVREN